MGQVRLEVPNDNIDKIQEEFKELGADVKTEIKLQEDLSGCVILIITWLGATVADEVIRSKVREILEKNKRIKEK